MSSTKEVLIYHNIPHTKYRWIAHFTLTNILLITFSMLLTEKTRRIRERMARERVREQLPDFGPELLEYKPKEVKGTISEDARKLFSKDIFEWANVTSLLNRPLYCISVFTGCGLITSAFMIYSRRMVHKITLLPNDRVRFAFFNPNPFAGPITKEIPLRNVSCTQGRDSKHNYTILRLKGYWGYHLVHKVEGKFLEPELFDKNLNYMRAWAEKE